MNKNKVSDFRDGLPDWLPPALVKDWRQMLRSPLYLLGVVAGAVLGAIVVLGEADLGLDAWDFRMMSFFGAVLLCAVLPARVSMMVAADVREVGTNFVRLTQLNSRQVVRGTWLSAVLQAVLLAVLALPMVMMRMMGVESGPEGMYLLAHLLLVVMMVMQSAAMIAAAQATATLPPLVRAVGASVGFLLAAVLPAELVESLLREHPHAYLGVGLHVLACAVMTLTLLEEARRPFAHPAENSLVSVRLCSLLALVVYAVVAYGAWQGELGVAWGAYVWASVLLVLVGVWDMLHAEGGAGARVVLCRLLPAGLQRSGVWGGAVWLLLVAALCYAALVPLVLRQYDFMHANWEAVLENWRSHEGVTTGLSRGALLLLHAYVWLDLLAGVSAAGVFGSLFQRQRVAAFLGFILVSLVAQAGLSGDFGEQGLLSLLPVWDVPTLAEVPDAYYARSWTHGNMDALVWLTVVKCIWLVVLLAALRFRCRAK